EKLFKVTNRIQSEVGRMTELMNDVLILGRVNSNSIKPDYQLSDVVVIIKEITSKHNDIELDGRKIKNVIKGNPYPLILDGHLLEHTISNLISNAFKYSKGRPAPILTINFERKRVLISIKDFGIGIPPNELKNLFQSFYRASNVNDFPGTGLGVAIAKEYAELNGGEISVSSKLNEGSEFTLVLKNN
ncbi:MAG: hybrid sensor histidine kinase/response regulator, partial [Flavobacteriales bacterium CG_4_9_14_3_um_filter_32_8]